MVESRPQQDTRLSLGRGGTDKGRSRSKNRSKSRSQSRSRSRSRRQMAGWIETKFNKILTHWEGFLDTDYDKEPKKETPTKKATPGTKKVESPVEAEKPTRGGRRNAPGGSGGGGMFKMSIPRPAREHIGRRGWMQCQSKEKGPRYSPGELTPDENVRVQEEHSFY